MDLPSPINFIFNYGINLKSNKDPDYNFLIKGFYNYLKLNGMKYDGIWSWVIVEIFRIAYFPPWSFCLNGVIMDYI